ncbi:MAG: DUF2158 domain-containing protein [Alphaproteobacteria bacterium]|nr:DUF2158 domain-containing protein [Alphaproteobacteria bacterium]
MANVFKLGDIVQLKSGGPAMTVAGIGPTGGYFCEWFKGASKDSAYFEEYTLKPYVALQKK